MARILVTIILIQAAGLALFVNPAQAHHHPFTTGLVEVLKIFGSSGHGDGGGRVSLRKAPSFASPVVQIITKRGQLDEHEHSYEVLSAVVYEKKHGPYPWYRVGYSVNGKKGKAWLSHADAGKYRPLAGNLLRGLTYSTLVWDSRLFEFPSKKAPSKKLRRKVSFTKPVAVATWTKREGIIWYLVVVLKDDICGGGKFTHHVLAAGWIPAHNKEGLSNVWFSSRGC